jgi:hypothetical protein
VISKVIGGWRHGASRAWLVARGVESLQGRLWWRSGLPIVLVHEELIRGEEGRAWRGSRCILGRDSSLSIQPAVSMGKVKAEAMLVLLAARRGLSLSPDSRLPCPEACFARNVP